MAWSQLDRSSLVKTLLHLNRLLHLLSILVHSQIPTPIVSPPDRPSPTATPKLFSTAGGDCDGPRQPSGLIPRVPCLCPPLKQAYLTALTANVLAGHAVNNTGVRVTFPTGNSVQDKHDRITAGVITLQNLKAAGVGCPGVSTTFALQSKNLDTCGDFQCGGSPAAASPPPPAASTAAPAPPANVGAGAQSTVTVTVQTVVTSTVTVTRGDATPTPQAPAQVVANPPPASSSAAAGNGNNRVLTRELVDQLAPQLGGKKNNSPNGEYQCFQAR